MMFGYISNPKPMRNWGKTIRIKLHQNYFYLTTNIIKGCSNKNKDYRNVHIIGVYVIYVKLFFCCSLNVAVY